jgi:hypothetical protein
MKIRLIKLAFPLTVLLFLGKNLGNTQVSQFELKESRTYLGTRSSWGNTLHIYNFSGETNTVSLPAGKKMTVIEFLQRPTSSHSSIATIEVQYTNSTEKFIVFSLPITGTSAIPTNGPVGKTFVGPCVIQVILIGSGELSIHSSNDINNPIYFPQSTLWRYEINDYGSDSTFGGSPLVSTASVVVPSNAVGDVDVLLEQSNDMITWTQCLPGTYNASTQKRFFRVRAVER